MLPGACRGGLLGARTAHAVAWPFALPATRSTEPEMKLHLHCSKQKHKVFHSAGDYLHSLFLSPLVISWHLPFVKEIR